MMIHVANKSSSFIYYVLFYHKRQPQFIYPLYYWQSLNLFPVFYYAARGTCLMQISLCTCVWIALKYTCRSGNAGPLGVLLFSSTWYCQNALQRSFVPQAVDDILFPHTPSNIWYCQTLKITFILTILTLSGKDILPMYNEALIKDHILNSFSKENDAKMQNKMLKF